MAKIEQDAQEATKGDNKDCVSAGLVIKEESGTIKAECQVPVGA